MFKWSVELEDFDIQCIPRKAIKVHTIADFVSELAPIEDSARECVEQKWILYVDGSAIAKRGAWLVLKGPDDQLFKHALCFEFKATNNEAKYEALLSRLRLAQELQVKRIKVSTDSQLVVSHISGNYETWDATIQNTYPRHDDLLAASDTSR